MKAEWTNKDSLTSCETTEAILVINQMPDSCYDCKYCQFDARKYNFRGCILTDTEVQDGTIDICKEVHSCCPLKPIPDCPDVPETISNDVAYILGWNDCIAEILRNEKKQNR